MSISVIHRRKIEKISEYTKGQTYKHHVGMSVVKRNIFAIFAQLTNLKTSASTGNG